MTDMDKAIAALRTYIGVKWRHQGRTKAGVDCVGLLVCAAADLGITLPDDQNYGMRPGSSRIIKHVLDQCLEIEPVDMKTGDILLVTVQGEDPQHIMIMTGPNQVLHASARHRKVVEHGLDEETRRLICKVFRPKSYNG